MHTSSLLRQKDISYQVYGADSTKSSNFATLFPDYHPQDRIGVISPYLEDGILNTSGVLLGFTISFYDVLRMGSADFFNYPQHFAFIGGALDVVDTNMGPLKLTSNILGAAWGWLDVWPETNWIVSPGHAENMIDQIFRYQINRVFWPMSLGASSKPGILSPLIYQMLTNRLKSVWYYDTKDPNIELLLSETAGKVVLESVGRLPEEILNQTSPPEVGPLDKMIKNQYQMSTPEEFLSSMQTCFSLKK